MSDTSITVIYHGMSLTTVHSNKGIIVFVVNWSAWSFLSECHP